MKGSRQVKFGLPGFALALACSAGAVSGTISFTASAESVVDYDIVYVRMPRPGDDKPLRWFDTARPSHHHPGSDLVLLHPDGTEDILVEAGDGAILDPCVSFDAEWVYYSKISDAALRTRISGSDIFKVHVSTQTVVQLTHQEWTPNTGIADWVDDPSILSPPKGKATLGHGILNLGPCPIAGGRIMFSSSRNGFMQAGAGSRLRKPALQLFVMDENGDNVEQVGHFNLGGALHPVPLVDGRVMFSSSEGQALRDRRS